MPTYTLGDLAQRHGLQSRGDATTAVHGVCGLTPGKPGHLGFLANAKLHEQLANSAASIIIVSPRHADTVRGAALIAPDPTLAYARIAALFDPDRAFAAVVHAGAFIADSAQIGKSSHVAAGVVIEAEVRIGEGSYFGPGCTIVRAAVIGAGTRLVARVSVGPRVVIGADCQVQAGAVLGSRGFGNARGQIGRAPV